MLDPWLPTRPSGPRPSSSNCPCRRRSTGATAGRTPSGGSTRRPGASGGAASPPPGPGWPAPTGPPGGPPEAPPGRCRSRRLRTAGTTVEAMPTVAERLEYPPDTKLLILHCAELGFCHASNVAVFEALRQGIGTAASLLVPAPWAREAAARYRGEDVGVRLALNAEHDLYRWGPITQAPSLLDGDGGFPRTATDLWDHADLDEVRRETRAQVERAVLWGFDVSHLDTHLDAMLLRPEFFDIYLELAVDFGLPLRMLGAEAEPNIGFPFRQLAADEGVLFADRFVTLPGAAPRRRPARAPPHPGAGPHRGQPPAGHRHPRAPGHHRRMGRAGLQPHRAGRRPGPRPGHRRRRGGPHRVPAAARRHAAGLSFDAPRRAPPAGDGDGNLSGHRWEQAWSKRTSRTAAPRAPRPTSAGTPRRLPPGRAAAAQQRRGEPAPPRGHHPGLRRAGRPGQHRLRPAPGAARGRP